MPTTDIAATGEAAEAPEEQRLGPFKCAAAAAGAASSGRGDFSKDPVGPPPSAALRGGANSRETRPGATAQARERTPGWAGLVVATPPRVGGCARPFSFAKS